MLPFMAQGAAQAIEDGAALSACLSAAGADGVAGALRRYEELRLPRTARIQAMSTRNKARFHLPDGPEQEERDTRMASGSTDWSINAGAWIYGAEAGAPAPHTQADLTGKVVLVLGGEGKGLRRRVAESCDLLVSIPVRGRVASLNVSAAAAVLLFEALRQRGSV